MKFSAAGTIGWASAAGVGTEAGILNPNAAGVGSLSWLDDETIVANMIITGTAFVLAELNIRTGAMRAIDAETANRARCGGGVITAWPGIIGGVRMYPDPPRTAPPFVLEYPGWDLVDVSHEGIVALQPGYNGMGLAILQSDGTPIVSLPNAGPLYFDAVSGTWAARVRKKFVSWVSLGQSYLYELGVGQLPVPARTEGVSACVPVPLLDGRCVLIEATDRLTARLSDSIRGIELTPPGELTFAIDAITAMTGSDETVRVVWSSAPGEALGTIGQTVFDPDVLSEDSITEDLNGLPVVSLETPTLFYVFAFDGVTQVLGNTALPIRPNASQLQALLGHGYKLILDPADAATFNLRRQDVDYFFCDLEGVTDVAAKLDRAHTAAAAFGKGIVIVTPSPAVMTALTGARKGDVVSPWVYREPGESLEAFRTRFRTELETCLSLAGPDVVVAVICGCVERYYPDGKISVTSDEAEQALAIASQEIARARRDPAIHGRGPWRVGVGLFRMGTSDHKPSIDDTVLAFYNGVAAPLPIPIGPPTPPPPTPPGLAARKLLAMASVNGNANFSEAQLIDAGGGNYGIKLHIPAECPFDGLGMVESPAGSGQWRLPLYDSNPQAPAPDGDYWLIVRPQGTCWALSVNDRDVHNLGTFGTFRKMGGVAFVTPHNANPDGSVWPTSTFGFIYGGR